jgi:hypothetical protein
VPESAKTGRIRMKFRAMVFCRALRQTPSPDSESRSPLPLVFPSMVTIW